MKRKKEISKLWRKHVGVGRLYWRNNNRRWRCWDTGEVARVRSGTLTIHFYSVEAILDEIERYASA